MKFICTLFLVTSTFLSACNTNNPIENNKTVNEEVISSEDKAIIVSVTTSGTETNYTFNVGISSPDTGCEQYADWWEVITEEGTLLYRRILAHSHVNEQPFIRSGGTVNISKNKTVIIRAHMNTSGYGIIAFKGSVENGFSSTTLDETFAQNLDTASPLPTGCNF